MRYSRTGHATANPMHPQAFAVCDRCGFVYNHKNLIWQNQWRGPKRQNLRVLVCEYCLDKPQEQLRTFIIPPDPVPIYTPRQEQYSVEVRSLLSGLGFPLEILAAEDGSELETENGILLELDGVATSSTIVSLLTENGDSIITEITDTPVPDPNNPVIYP